MSKEVAWRPVCLAELTSARLISRQRLRGKDMSNTKKVMEATARALADISAGPDIPSGLNKCCRSIQRRLKWVVAHSGRLSTSYLVEKWAGGGVRVEEE